MKERMSSSTASKEVIVRPDAQIVAGFQSSVAAARQAGEADRRAARLPAFTSGGVELR